MPLVKNIVQSLLPVISGGDGTTVLERNNRYGDPYGVFTLTPPSAQAIETTRFVSTSVPGTDIAGFGSQQAFSETQVMMHMLNTASGGGKSIILDYLKFQYTSVPASTTGIQFAVTTDTATRSPSGGGTALTPVNCTMNSAVASVASGFIGGMNVNAASGSRRFVSRSAIKTGIAVVGDEVFINFGALDSPSGPLSGANANILSIPSGPVVIGPGHVVLFHLWHPGPAWPSVNWQYEMGWLER